MSLAPNEAGSSSRADDPYFRAMSAMCKKFKPDSITGEVETVDMIQYVSMHLDDPDVQTFLRESKKRVANQKEERRKALAEFDIDKLEIDFAAVWLISLEYAGLTTDPKLDDDWDLDDVDDPETEAAPASDSDSEKESEPKQKFQLYCYIRDGPDADDGMNSRHIEEFIGLPTSKQVEDFIKVSMAAPLEIYEPSIPRTLAFSYNLNPHRTALLPFLHSLPFPCNHIFETAEIHQRMADQAYPVGERRYREYIELATKLKDAGNEAYSRGNREEALEKYREAIYELDKLLLKSLSEAPERDKETKELLAVCWANTSAAKLLDVPGEAKDAEGARNAAEKALEVNGDYAKGYVRLARAFEALNDRNSAQEAIVRGLRRPSLRNHFGLADHLISLQTDGKGLPTGKDQFQVWLNSEPVSILSDLGGAWEKRWRQHEKTITIQTL